MDTNLQRSVDEPIREGLTWDERWKGQDSGLIFCWETGRQIRAKQSDLAVRAEHGELVVLSWKGGVEAKLKNPKPGALQYLATWQGLRGDDLAIATNEELTVVCSKFQQAVIFSSTLPDDDPDLLPD